jgi:nicotinamide-nucleotide amidase
LSLELQEDPQLVMALEERFRARGIRMAAINLRQAQVPRGAVVLKNDRGTAPGLWIDVGHRVVILLPGPPRELQPIVDDLVLPRLRARTSGRQVRRRVIKITGRAESAVEEVAQPIYAPLAHGAVPIVTSILAAPGQIELHLSAAGEDAAAMDAALDAGVGSLAGALAPSVFSVDGRSLEEVVGAMLLGRGLHIAVAESCTGGLVLGKLTDVPGSSGWVIGGVVAYDNDVKTRELGVPGALLAEHGAVSEPVALAMATGVRERLGADVGVAITGIAGPTGGSEAKPVGTVVIAVSAAQNVVRTFRFLGDRSMVRQFSVAAALDLVRRTL